MPIAETLAGTIRKVFTRSLREQAIGRLAYIATDPGIDPIVQIRAFECLSRYGWPEERSGQVGLRIVGKNAQVLVQHVHQPIGIVTTGDDGPGVPYAGVKLGKARHLLESSAPGQAPESVDGRPDDDPLAAPASPGTLPHELP
jgi:hypothetical protein